ncbi:hypothetical protein F5Y05DRAFT_420034 [Hypoxylon sp. FL0543]|nr:hypothetical protein F5Y05DRAFT_420034 [Hypoxylon sp. FL0543]
MDPVSILPIVQLSFSVVELGSKVVREFSRRNDRVPDKLKSLNDLLGQFHSDLEDIIQKHREHNAASSSLTIREADAIIETLTECKDFLRQYESTTTNQGLVLLLSSNSTKIEELDRRIRGHYLQLRLIKAVDVQDAAERFTELIVAMHMPQQTNNQTETPPQSESTGKFKASPENYSVIEVANQPSFPSFPRSPIIPANSRNLSPLSTPQLPSPLMESNHPSGDDTRRQLPTSPESGPVMAYLSRTSYNTARSGLTRIERETDIGPSIQVRLATSPASQHAGPEESQHIPSQPPSVTLGPNSATYELEDSGPHELNGDAVFQIPPPSLTTPYYSEEIRSSNIESLFAAQQAASQGQGSGEFRDDDSDLLSREPG